MKIVAPTVRSWLDPLGPDYKLVDLDDEHPYAKAIRRHQDTMSELHAAWRQVCEERRKWCDAHKVPE